MINDPSRKDLLKDDGMPARFLLAGILVVYLTMATTFSFLVPLGEAPDEVPHYHFMRFLAANRALPFGTEAGSEGFQPPLYYAIGAILSGWVDEGAFAVKANPDFSWQSAETSRHLLLHTSQERFPYEDGALAWHIGRIWSVLLGAVTVIGTYFIALELFPKNRLLALGAAAFNAFIPEFLFMSGAMNNDNLVAALSSMALLALLRLSRGHPNAKTSLVAGALIGAAILAKTNALVFLPLAALAVAASALYLEGWGRRTVAAAVNMGIVLSSASAVCGWWFWRNQILHGDPLGWQLKLGISDLRQAPLGFQDLVWLASGLFQSFWGRFGGAAHIRMDERIYWMLGALSVVSLFGLITACIRGMRHRTNGLRNAVPFALVLALVLLTFASLIRWTMTYLGTDQARLIYPILSVIAILFARGIFEFLPAKGSVLAIFVAACGVFAVASPFVFVLPNYEPAPSLASEVTDKDLGEIDGHITLGNYLTNPGTLIAGESGYLSLSWIVTSRPERDLWLSIQLADDTGRVAYQKDTAPTRGAFTTDTWEPGSLVTSLHTLQVPDFVPPATYTLRIGAHPFGSTSMVPVKVQGIQSEDRLLVLGKVSVVKR